MTTTAEWGMPDSDLCSAALQLAFDVTPAFLANHCLRSFLFGRELAAATGQRSGVDYDEEDLFLACILHDLGLSDHAMGDQRFEVDGADAAARFLRERGVTEDRVAAIWQAIALHTSVGLADRFGPLQALAFRGISVDVIGSEQDLLPPGFADRVHVAWPRHDLGYAIAAAIAAGVDANPMKAPPFSFPAQVHQLVTGAPSPTFYDVVGWGDATAK